MATYLWSNLLLDANVNFNPDTDILIFDSGITSYTLLQDWDLQSGFSTFTDTNGKTVTFTGLGVQNITPDNIQFDGSPARFLVGDLSTNTNDGTTPNTIVGSDGNDVILGYGGSGNLSGGAGDDLIYAMSDGMWIAGHDTIDGGAGLDWFSLDPLGWVSNLNANLMTGRAYYGPGISTLQNIEGLAGGLLDDRLIGNNQDNFFRGRQGDDQIFGRGGNDWVYYDEADALAGVDIDLNMGIAYDDGFGGMDRLYTIENVRGGHFDDLIVGSGGDNVLWGEAGNDTLIGSWGSDTLRGGLGDDLLQGGEEDGSSDYNDYDDPLNVGDYSDAVGNVTVDLNLSGPQNTGGAGTDTLLNIDGLLGGQFDDSLTGNAVRNILSGNAGNDSLYGGAGDDTLDGGAGDDLIEGGSGSDTASYANALIGVTVNLTQSGSQDTGEGMDTLTSIENLVGSKYFDKLTGNASANRLEGGNGNDTLIGLAGDDTLDGGLGADVLNGGAGIDTASYAKARSAVTVDLNLTTYQNTGGGGNDRLIGIETVEGSKYNDVLIASSTGNTLNGSFGNDTLIGGAGDDILIGKGEGNASNDWFYDPLEIDTVSYANASSGITVDLSNSQAQYIGDDQGTDTLTGIDSAIGSSFDDFIATAFFVGHGEGQTAMIDGGAGNDIIKAYMNSGNYVLNGGLGSDTLVFNYQGNAGLTVDLNSAEAQLANGSYSSITLVSIENVGGTDGNDHFIGSAGNNTIFASNGNDTLEGGAGVDTLSYAQPDPQGWTNVWGGVNISLAITTAQDNTSFNQGTATISGFENLTGSAFSDTLTGNNAANVIEGGDGNDTIDGAGGFDTASYASATSGVTVNLSLTGAQFTYGAGSDTLISIERLTGSDHDDNLTGNNGANQLRGGLGADMLTGGGGADQFMYGNIADSAAGGAFDTITDFTAAESDKINLLLIDANTGLAGNQAFSFIGSAAFSAAGQVRFENGTVYANVDADLGADLQIELTGVSSLVASDFVL